MTEINTEDLTDGALDWAVAEATGYDVFIRNGQVYQSIQGTPDTPCFGFRPSARWDQGGPLIGRFEVVLGMDDYANEWHALAYTSEEGPFWGFGRDHLEAACRAIVAAKLGPTVDIPEDLV